MALFILLMFSSTAFSTELSGDRLIPQGKVTLFKENQKIGECNFEAPLPKDTLLSVQGQCGVKMKNIYLVAMDKSLFSIKTGGDSRILSLENGTVFFALSSMPLMFQTPQKLITTNEILLNTSSGSGLLKGYISVENRVTKIGVLEGGSMVLTIGDDETTRLKSGQELQLAQADLFDVPAKETEEEAAKKTKEKPVKETATETAAPTEAVVETTTVTGVSTTSIIAGVAVLGAAAAAAGGGGGGGGGGSPPASPSSP
jgi:hypothetical protein